MRKKILVIDDDEAIGEVFELVLRDAGYNVALMTKGSQEMQQQVKVFSPDLIILDLLISGADGRQLCQQLKGENKTKPIPVIMISAHPDAKQAALEAGADVFLAKPFELVEILTLAEKYTA